MKSYVIGDYVRLSAVFDVTLTGVPIDPGTVTLTIKPPSTAKYSKTYGAGQITRDSAGSFHYDVLADDPGTWTYKWVSTAAGAGASVPATFVVVADPTALLQKLRGHVAPKTIPRSWNEKRRG